MGNRTEHNSPWKDGFLFVGNRLALDFLNTRPVQNDRPIELLPDFNTVLRWFHAAGLLTGDEVTELERKWAQSALGCRVVNHMLTFREKLRQAVLRWEDGQGLDHSVTQELNRLMSEHPMRTRLKKTGRSLSTELYFKADRPDHLFAPLVHSAAMLFAGADRERVRRCDQCVLHFLDTSKKGTRRWCSMQLCGNRSKVAAYAARQRTVDDEY